MSDSDDRALRQNELGWDAAFNKGKSVAADKARNSEAKILKREQTQKDAPYIKPSVEPPAYAGGDKLREAAQVKAEDRLGAKAAAMASMLGGKVEADTPRAQKIIDRTPSLRTIEARRDRR